MPDSRDELDQVPTAPPHVEMRLLSQPRYLCGARDAVSSISKRFGFDDQTAGQLALAVDEALCNIIRHGYGGAGDRPIWLRIWPLGGKAADGAAEGIRIVLEDEAEQVEPTKIKSRDLAEVRPGGLGVHIIQQIMTAARYEKRDGAQGGMRLIMSKRLEPKQVSTGSASTSGERPAALVKGKG